jgi:hypothetical protein
MYASGTETRISRNFIPEFNKRGIDIIIKNWKISSL